MNERSFEAGLLWLERQVALRQAGLRGFFTYSDLAASCDCALLREVAGALRAACAGYLSGLLTVLASTLVLSQAWLPALQYAAARGALSALDTNVMTQQPDIAPFNNRTLDPAPESPPAEPALPDKLKCCTRWLQYQDRTDTKNHWQDNNNAYDWKSFETWWSKTPLLNWLYHSSVIGPMQRWLEIVDEYADLFKKKLYSNEGTRYGERCGDHHCVRQWLNLSKLNMLLASAADR